MSIDTLEPVDLEQLRSDSPTTRAGRNALTEAAVRARLDRGEILLALSDGLITFTEMLALATDDDYGRPYRRLKLSEVLSSLPGWSRRRTDAVLKLLGERYMVSGKVESLTIEWVLSERSQGARTLVLSQAVADHYLPTRELSIWTDGLG